MNRRQFLASLGIGTPSAILVAKLGVFEAARKYFFAPKGGWPGHGLAINLTALQLELVCATVPLVFGENDAALLRLMNTPMQLSSGGIFYPKFYYVEVDA